jgi:hypothetical protein
VVVGLLAHLNLVLRLHALPSYPQASGLRVAACVVVVCARFDGSCCAGKRVADSVPSTWIVYRRYRDFYEFQSIVKKLGFNVTAPFPGKKAFGRFGDEFLVTRHKMLNAWLRALLDIRAPVRRGYFFVCACECGVG